MQPYVENMPERQFLVSRTPAQLFPQHLHSQAEMVYVLEGTQEMLVDGRPCRLEAGDLCLCFPGVVHGYLSNGDHDRLMIIFSPELWPDFSMQLSCSQPENAVLRSGQLPQDVALCMSQIQQERDGACDERVLRGYVQVVLARILPLMKLHNREPQHWDIVYELARYLSVHYAEPVTLAQLSRALGVSKSYLSHIFSQRFGVHFRTYVNTLRANHACELLHTGSYSITEVGFECGFESQRTFNRVFAELYGMSPSEYRRRNSAG